MNTLRFLSTLSPLLALAVAASAETPMDVAREAAAEYRRAMLGHDFASFDKSSTADFVYVDLKGQKATKAQALVGMKQGLSTIKFTKYDVKAVSAKAAEGGILYVQESMMAGTMVLGGAKPSKLESSMRDEVLLVKKGGHWLTKRVKSLKDVTMVNGKPVSGM